MMLCVAPNPAVDRTVAVDTLSAGDVTRAVTVHEGAGGKGLNVARAVLVLGGDPVVCGPVGGWYGARIQHLATAEGLEARWIEVKGETRACTIIAEASGRSTVINEPGPGLAPDEWARLMAEIAILASRATTVTISGSMPGGAAGRLAALAEVAVASGVPVWVDTAGEALRAAMAVPGVALKVNAQEAASVLTPGDPTPVSLAARLHRQSAATEVVVTAGAAGAAASLRGGEVIWCDAPPVAVRNATGSGDAFLGALVLARSGGAAPAAALAQAVAAGAASAMAATATLDASLMYDLLATSGGSGG